MAEKNVALELKVEGVNKIIQEVKDLQAEILRLKDILKGVEEGSDAYDTLSQSIQGLEGKLETVKITAQETGVVLENTGTEGAAAMNKVSDSATKAGNTIQDAGKKVKEVNLVCYLIIVIPPMRSFLNIVNRSITFFFYSTNNILLK